MTSRDFSSPDLSVADKLDDEIAKLRAQVESLKNELSLQTATLLASDSVRDVLQDDSNRSGAHGLDASARSRLLTESDKQVAHQRQSLYRACATITALKIRDPDPNAVDGGNVLGLRFEVMSRARFIRPYYVMLNRPYARSQHLRIHRHTVPPCIAISGLAARHLPAPRLGKDGQETQHQDLPRFARALRRELVRYQNRITTIGDLRKAAGLGNNHAKRRREDDEAAVAITDISAVDAEAKQVRLEWEDGRVGRLVMDDDGKISKVAVQAGNERDRRRVRELLGGSTHIQDLMIDPFASRDLVQNAREATLQEKGLSSDHLQDPESTMAVSNEIASEGDLDKSSTADAPKDPEHKSQEDALQPLDTTPSQPRNPDDSTIVDES
ncbi:hypothetical protein G7054_g8871 [Neopestalotiopsis clavispora]|nr:hypothetical protein G7054_g8871 [Neopestalotiopsis clavispora]